MLKGKSKAFKPKGPSRPRPAASVVASREPTVEPTAKETTPSAKRKDREEDDVAAEPPAKRIPIPAPTTLPAAEEQSIPPTAQTVLESESSQPPLPTPAPTPSDPSNDLPTSPAPQTSSPTLARRQLPSTPAATASAPIPQPTIPPELPAIADEAPSRSVASTNLGPGDSAILSAPSPSATSPSTSRANLSTAAAPTNPPARPTPKASLGTAGSAAVLASPVQATAGASLGPAGGSVISKSRVQNGGITPAPALGRAGDVGEESDAGPSRVSQLVPMAALNPDGTPGGPIQVVAKKKRKVVKSKKGTVGEDDRAGVEMIVERPRRKKGTAAASKKKKKKKDKQPRVREETPESAEDEEVDPATLTMSELCKDLRIGKKFSRHNDIKERVQKQKDIVKAARLARNNPEAAAAAAAEEQAAGQEGQPAAEGEGGSAAGAEVGRAEPVVEEEPSTGPLGTMLAMRIVDGQIVLDERTLQIDRHRDGQNDAGPTEIIEENDFTRITTSGTYMKREKTQAWDWAAMEMFYKGLRTFGTDFGMIANMFPHRSRKQIKLKFNKEERENPERLNRALAAPQLPIDFSEYEKLAENKYVEVEEIEAEQQALADEHNATQAASAAELAAATKKKKDAIRKASGNAAREFLDGLSDDEDVGGTSSAKENRVPSAGGSRSREQSAAAPMPGRRKKGAGKPSKANKHSMRAGGETFEVVDMP